MIKITTLILLLFASHSGIQGSQKSEHKGLSTPSYKKIGSEHFTLLFSGITVLDAQTLLKKGELFFSFLEKEWGIKLKNTNVKISIYTQRGHNNKQVDYSRSSNGGVIRLSSFDEEKSVVDLYRAAILCLLNQGDASLAPFFQNGISLYFSNTNLPDKDLLATFALLLHPKPDYFLKLPDSAVNDPHSNDVLSYLFVDKLWEYNRKEFIMFLHLFLQGNSAEESINQSGLGTIDSTLKEFQTWAKGKYNVSRIAFFPGFWKLLFVLLVLSITLFHFWRSWRLSGLPHETLLTHDQNLERKLIGPAFGNLSESKIQADMPEGQSQAPSKEVKGSKKIIKMHITGMDELSAKTNHKRPVEIKEAPQIAKAEEDLEKAVEIIEEDLDHFFNLKEKKKAKKIPIDDSFKDVDDQIDHLFDL